MTALEAFGSEPLLWGAAFFAYTFVGTGLVNAAIRRAPQPVQHLWFVKTLCVTIWPLLLLIAVAQTIGQRLGR